METLQKTKMHIYTQLPVAAEIWFRRETEPSVTPAHIRKLSGHGLELICYLLKFGEGGEM